MKKVLIMVASLLVLSASAFAQEKETFYPGWQYGIQVGANYTAGEMQFKDMLSPSVGISAGYQFNPWFTLRGVVSGYESKGAAPNYSTVYKFNYAQLDIDGVFDICNMFKYRSTRTVNPYLLAGIGGNVRFNNGQAADIQQKYPEYKFPYLWSEPTVSFTGRVGAGVEFRCSDAVKLSLEVVDNFLTDKFNSKRGNYAMELDYNIAALAGIKFTFGQARKKAEAAADAAAQAKAIAEAAAAKAAADKAAAEKAAADKAAAEKAAADKAAAEAAEKAAAEKAAAEAAAKAAKEAAWNNAKSDPSKNVYFAIGKYDIRKSEAKKIATLAETLKNNPDMVVEIVGAADSETGSKELNLKLSENRAEVVKAALVKAGVPESRITSRFIGDTMEFSADPAKNRVAIMVTE